MRAVHAESELDSVSWRRAWPHLLVVFAGAACLYAATMPRSIALEDDGSFIMAARFLGIAHPPGYPLWVLLAKPFTWIPGGSVAFRVHLASGVFGALACAVLWWIARRLTRGNAPAYFAASAFAVSEVMWSQSLIADVYSLNVLLLLILLAQLLDYGEAPSRARFMAVGFVYGLGLSNHWPLLVLATPGLLLLLWPQRKRLLRDSLVAAPALILGLTPYLWMVLRSNADPETSFVGPIRDLREALSFLARRAYSQTPQNVSATLADQLDFGRFYVREFAAQFTPVGCALAIAGGVFTWRTLRPSISLGLLAIFLGSSFALVPTFGVDYDFLERLMVRVFPIVAYAVTAIWLGQGLRWAGEVLRPRIPRAADAVTAAVALSLVGTLLLGNLAVNDRSRYRFAEAYGTAVLESLAPDAILFTRKDFDVFPLGYLSLVEGVRPDVELYHPEALVFSTRLYHQRADRKTKTRVLSEFLQRTERPIYFMNRIPGPYAWEDFGFYSRLDKGGRPGQLSHALREDLLALAHQMRRESEISDAWSVALSRTTTAAFSANLYVAAHAAGVSEATRTLAARHAADFRTSYYGLAGQISAAASLGGTAAAEALAWADAAEAMLDESIGRRHRADLFAARGKILVQLGRDAEAGESFERAIALSPQPQNSAILGLMRLHALGGRRDEYDALRRRFFSNRIGPSELIELDRTLEQQLRK